MVLFFNFKIFKIDYYGKLHTQIRKNSKMNFQIYINKI